MTKLISPLWTGVMILVLMMVPSWNLSANSEPPPYPPFSSPVIPGGENLIRYLAKTYGKSFEEMWEVVYYASLHADESFPTATDILAIIAVESHFDPRAVSQTGSSLGLMQINAMVHKGAGLLDPATNIARGSKILKGYWTGNRRHTFVVYNKGPTGALFACGGLPECSTEYSEKVATARQAIASRWRKS